MKKKISTEIKSFTELRENDYLYVDKTELIYDLATRGFIYFFSRPRRFGKSLIVSTLEALFSGRKDLFEGLFIYDKWDWTQQYPVILLDYDNLKFGTPKELEESLMDFLESTANKFNLSLSRTSYVNMFSDLLRELHRATGKHIVVLFDGSYKPVSAHLSDVATVKAHRTILNYFYQVLKGGGEHAHIIFLTDISKFYEDTPFSAFNSPFDATSYYKYASMCGFTRAEVEHYFDEYIDEIVVAQNISRNELLDKLEKWYGGYSWDAETFVFNPFSILSFFKTGEFRQYWDAEIPEPVFNSMRASFSAGSLVTGISVDSSVFDGYDPVRISSIAFLTLTGFMTVKRIDRSYDFATSYDLEIANDEIRIPLFERVLHSYSAYPLSDIPALIADMQKQICDKNILGLEQNLNLLFGHLPDLDDRVKAYYYNSLFLLALRLIGFDFPANTHCYGDFSNAVWRQAELTVVVEIRSSIKKKAEELLIEATQHISNNKLYEPDGTKTILLSVVFDGDKVVCAMTDINSDTN
jgi:hypothetical protein